MGAGESLPEGQLDELLETTSFKKQELKRWYAKFIKDYPDGELTKDQFKEMYKKIFKANNSTQMAERIFRTFDENNDGHISFKELMSSMSVTSRGSVEDKLRWAFNIYDIDESGTITIEEVGEIMRSMTNVAHAVDDKNSLNDEEITAMFEAIDVNSDGHLTVDEFIAGVLNYPRFISMLNGSNSASSGE